MSGDGTGSSDGGEPAKSETQRSIPTPFLTKTYQIVDDPNLDDLISWNEDGTSFVVWRPAEFARDLLPKYFKHNNFSSFVRQLNTYGFRKVVPDRWEFANDCFRRGEKAMLRDIQRRKITPPTPPSSASASAATALPVSAVALLISPANSGDEQVLSSNSSLAEAATPPLALRACTSIPEILEENERLRRENSRLGQELNRLRTLCGNIYSLMSRYVTNPGEAELPELGALELFSETPGSAEERRTGEGTAEEEMCHRIFGVSIGVKRLKCEDGTGEDRSWLLRGREAKSEPLDQLSSSINGHHSPMLDK